MCIDESLHTSQVYRHCRMHIIANQHTHQPCEHLPNAFLNVQTVQSCCCSGGRERVVLLCECTCAFLGCCSPGTPFHRTDNNTSSPQCASSDVRRVLLSCWIFCHRGCMGTALPWCGSSYDFQHLPFWSSPCGRCGKQRVLFYCVPFVGVWWGQICKQNPHCTAGKCIPFHCGAPFHGDLVL